MINNESIELNKIDMKALPSVIMLDKNPGKVCGNCGYWVGGWVLIEPPKRMCLCPLTEEETYVNIAGWTTPTDTCSRHEYNKHWEKAK